MTDATLGSNTSNDPPPAPPTVHLYCGGRGRAVCGHLLILDPSGPCFSTSYDDITCDRCRAVLPPLTASRAAPSVPREVEEALREVEWVLPVHNDRRRCPYCAGGYPDDGGDGHNADCVLAKALRLLGGADGQEGA